MGLMQDFKDMAINATEYTKLKKEEEILLS
jgi:hypothetical protein